MLPRGVLLRPLALAHTARPGWGTNLPSGARRYHLFIASITLVFLPLIFDVASSRCTASADLGQNTPSKAQSPQSTRSRCIALSKGFMLSVLSSQNAVKTPSCDALDPPLPYPRSFSSRIGTSSRCDLRCPQGAGFSRTTRLTLRSYSTRSLLNRLYASACAGDSGFGSSSRS